MQQEQKTNKKSKSETGTISFWCSYGKGPYGHSWTSSDHQKRKQVPVNGNRPIYKMVRMFPVIHTDSRRSCKELG